MGQMGHHKTSTAAVAKAALATCAAALLCLVFASSALATDEHLFDPVLSLEGRCTAEDGVADPGCPYAEPSEGGPRTIENPCGTAVDSHGDIYVANMTPKTTTEGWIDIFDPEGKFITRIDADEQQPCRLAVDSQGNLYMETGVHEERGIHGTVYKVELYEPDSYPPTASTDFGSPETVIVEEQLECGALAANGVTTTPSSIAVDPSDDHLYVALGCEVAELGSAAEGSPLIDESIGLEQGSALSSVAIGRGHDVYVGGATRTEVAEPRIFVFDGEDSHLKCEIDGAETPAGRFDFRFGQSGVGADHSNGDLYVANVGSTYHEIDQFGVEGEECRYIGTLPETSPKALKPPLFAAQVAVDAPVEGEEGYDSPNEGYVYVGSGEVNKAHLYAFAPVAEPEPEEFLLTVSKSGSGTVNSEPAGIDCGPFCSAEFEAGTEVTLTPSPESGAEFTGWSGCDAEPLLEGVPACVVTIEEAREVTANFEPEGGPEGPPLTLAIEEGEGTVVSDPAGIECVGAAPTSCSTEEIAEGETVTLTASPAAGFLFKSWKGCDKGGIVGRKCTVSLSEAKAVGAKFVPSFDVTLQNGGGGKVYSRPGGALCLTNCTEATASFKVGKPVEVLTKPNKHFHLVQFGGDCSGTTCSGIEADATVSASFAEDPTQTLSFSKIGGGQGLVKSKPAGLNCAFTCSSQAVHFYEGEELTISWKLGKGTSSIEWSTGADTCTGSSEAETGSCTVTMDEAHSLVARFE